MNVCLYLEFLKFQKGFLFRRIGTGLLSSYKNQKKILETLNIPYCESWNDSCDILMINTPWLKSLYLINKAKRQGKKVIIWSHVTAEDTRAVFRFGALLAPLMKKYLAYAYSKADIVLCPSEYTRNLLAAYGLPRKKLAVQSNGVDLGKFYPDQELKAAYRKRYGLGGIAIGTVGLAVPRKGIDTFLKLAGQFKESRFIWYGKIYSSLMVKSLPMNLPDNCRFTGYVDDINAAFNSLDIFVFPSYEENQGMAILEAAAAGLPILVRDIPVYQGWLKHDVNCLKAKNDDEFAEYLGRLINDGGLRLRLSEGARSLSLAESSDRLADNLKTILEGLA